MQTLQGENILYFSVFLQTNSEPTGAEVKPQQLQ